MNATRTPRVVVGVDDSLSGLAALRFAVTEARRRGVPLRAIRAWRFVMSAYELDAVRCRAEAVDAAAMMVHNAFQQAMGGVPTDITVEALAVEGSPAWVLTAQAGEHDLLVVGQARPDIGWRGFSRRFWRGLTGQSRADVQCVRTAICPVVTVGAPALARELTSHKASDVVGSAEAMLRDAAGRRYGRPAQPA